MADTGRSDLFSKELRFFLVLGGFNLLMFTVFRLAFLAVYSSGFELIGAGEIFRAFGHGLRFDAAIIVPGLVGALVLSFLPFVNRFRPFRLIWVTFGFTATFFFFILLLADLQYYEFAGKKLGYEAFVYLDASLFPILATAVAENPLYQLVGLVAGLGLAGFYWLMMKHTKILSWHPISLKSYGLVVLVMVPISILLIRGGWQRVPLRTADSFISQHSVVNVLTMNSPYLALRNLGKSKTVKLMDDAEAEKIALSLLDISPKIQLNPKYPLLVASGDDSSGVKPYNVVIFLMESWTGKFTGPLGDTLGITPRYNRLAADGLIFERFYANGFRSGTGLFSTLTGIPDQVGTPVLRRQELQDSFASLSVVLGSFGYRNIFVHGGLLDFDNLRNMLIHEGFDAIVGKEELSDCGGIEHTWGYDDEFSLERAHQEFVNCGQTPFFGFVFSVTTHAPFELPEKRHYIFDESDHPEYRYLNAYRYADYSLGKFFDLARQADYFDRTLFIILGDHTHHSNLDIYENQHLPMLIYAPGIVEPGRRFAVGSQVDIPATVAGVLNLPFRADMGRDLMQLDDSSGFAFWVGGASIGWIENGHIATMGLDERLPLVYDYRTGDFGTDVALTNPSLARDIKQKASAYYQFSSSLLFRDAILPPGYSRAGSLSK